MKILFVANVAKEHINKFHIPTIKCFKENGWEVHVACSGDAEVPECHKQYNMCWERSPFTLKTFKGIGELKKILKKENYDVVYCHTPVGGLVARLASRTARKQGTKVIYCAHGLHFFKGAPLINWLIYYPLEKIMSYFTDAIFTVNKEDYNTAKKSFSKKAKIRLIPEVGVDFNRLKIANPKEVREHYRKSMSIDANTTVLIYVAELIKNKNQTMLIDTVKILLDKGENIKLILPGPDHADGKIEEYINSLDLSEYITTLGWRSDIGELMHSADICVASSIREGFGINLVEAMYCGLPVVATKNRGHEMIINDNENGFLVDINDSDKMAERILSLIHDKNVRDKMSNLDVSMFDCYTVANEIYNIICNE